MMLWLCVWLYIVNLAIAREPLLSTALTLETPVNGISTTPEGRLFLLYARVDGSTGPSVVEQIGNSTVPYPNSVWNSYKDGDDPATHFVRINSQRIGPDGALWIVDVGSPSFGAPVIQPYGTKLIQVNLTTNEVQRVYFFGEAILSNSFLDDVRFNPATGKAYLTDAGAPSLIVLDLASGNAKRVLENTNSTMGYMPVSAEGNLLHGPGGAFEYIYADQLEVSPDGCWLYFQPCSGGLSRIETSYLDEAFCNETISAQLEQFVEPYAHTPSTGGTAIDADGSIYVSDTDRQTILKIFNNGTMTVFLDDPRLLWVDAMWVDTQGRLWMPAAQLNRGTPFNNGSSYIQKPLYVYTTDIGVGPSPIDHA